MSRSYKKPYGPVCSGQMKKWKKESNKKLRKIPIDFDNKAQELSNGNNYKKFNDVWSSPSDGKRYYGEDPKHKRK